MGESTTGIEADSERDENNDLRPGKAHNVGVSPKEDRSRSKSEMGEDKGSEQEIDRFSSLGSLLRVRWQAFLFDEESLRLGCQMS